MEFNFNKYQSQLTQEMLEKYPQEIQEQFIQIINGIPLVKSLIAADRPHAINLPRKDGKIIVDITKPHILENMDYFRPAALHFKKYGCYTNLTPNKNPKSEYGKWIREEIRRCYEGYVRESDGEWITGDYYFFLNYCPIQIARKEKGNKKRSQRVIDFPNVWEGHYYLSHYLEQARDNGHHAFMLAARGKGKSYFSASRVAKRFVLGESREVNKKVQVVVTASERKYIQGANQILDMFVYYIDFLANNTQFPARRLTNSLHDMQWTMGYIDADNGTKKGTLNSVTGVTCKDDESKLRGSRGQVYVIEEAGSFPRLLQLYAVLRPSVEDGNNIFGQIFAYGCVCAGTKVWTNNGRYINIEELKKDDGIIGYENDLPVKNSIGTLLEPKKKPCIRITYNTDKILECSVDHPILKQVIHTPRVKGTLHSRNRTHEEVWVRANELKVGDKIIEGRYIGAFGNDVLDDARLIGMLIGDGSYGFDNTPRFSNEDEELLNYIKSKYQWSLNAEHITKQGKLYQEIRVKNICQLLRKVGIYGQTKMSKRLPVNYQTLTEQDTKDLLAGLFDTDGCVHLKGEDTTISLVQSNKEILEQVQLLLRKFGILSYIAVNKPNIKYNRKDKNPWYILSIKGRVNIRLFKKYIPIIQNGKVNKLNEICTYFNDNPMVKKRCWNEDKIIIRTISKIENIGIQTIYNLSAEQSHTYLANNIITHNTAGDNESDFSSMQEIMYNPKGYNVQELENVYDIEGQGRKEFTYFFPSYMNMAECYDKDGNSDVIKALFEILKDRYVVKYNSTDIRMITKRMAELPITPKEAVLQTSNNLFPVSELQERLLEIDNNPTFYNDTYIGELVLNPDGTVNFKPTLDTPIRDFKVNDNNIVEGALEIYEMPVTDINGKVIPERYIIGHDPVDNDEDKQGSLSSTFVLDLWTDRIVAEYTGRKKMAEDNFEILRRLCIFYNAKCLYEQNIKGCFAYFSQKNCLYLLADTPEYLVDKQLVKTIGYGNTSKGVRATLPINNYANKLIQQWMLKPIIKTTTDSIGQEVEVQVPNLFNIKNRALLKECVLYTPLQGNYDRIRALGLVMLYREMFVVMYQGILDKGRSYVPDDYIGNDPFFVENYNNPYDNEVESY